MDASERLQLTAKIRDIQTHLDVVWQCFRSGNGLDWSMLLDARFKVSEIRTSLECEQARYEEYLERQREYRRSLSSSDLAIELDNEECSCPFNEPPF